MIRTVIDAALVERARLSHARNALRRVGPRGVAQALFRLNHAAKGSTTKEQRDAIYALKGLIIEDFHGRGYCVRVFTDYERDALLCTPCQGRGCSACNGAGIIRREFMCFVFQVQGQVYVWHHPARYVTFLHERPEQAAEDTGEGEPGPRGDSASDYALVYAYLRSRGIERDALPALDVFQPVRERLRETSETPRRARVRGRWFRGKRQLKGAD